jgi:PKD repeat protein
MAPIRNAVPNVMITARSRDARLTQAAFLFSVVLYGAVGCADAGVTQPLGPENLGFVDAVAPDALKREADAQDGLSANLSPSASLSAASADAPAYSVSSIPFAAEVGPFLPPEGFGHGFPGADDLTWGGANGLPIGFSFTFFGQSFDRFWIASNGAVLFQKDPRMDGACCGGFIPLNDPPNPAAPGSGPKNNLVALAWSDLKPLPGQVTWTTRGEAPNRRLIVDFNQVPYFVSRTATAPSPFRVTTQLILYERTNVIEIHTKSQQNPGNKLVTQGIENATGTEAYFRPGRNAAVFALPEDAVRFAPPQQNSAPTANAGGNVGEAPNKSYEGVEGVAVDFNGSAFDADGDDLTYSWDFDNNGSVDATTLAASFTYVDNGSHSALLKVSDGREVTEARVNVVIHNAKPVVNAGSDLRVLSGSTVSLSGQFSDKGANDAFWSWTWNLGSLGSYSDKTANPSDAILASQKFCKAGVYAVSLTVTDKDDASGSDELLVTVDAQPIKIDVNPNSINLNGNGHGMITVRIYSREGLDATALRPEAIRLTNGSGSGTQLAVTGGHLHWNDGADLNGDGRPDVSAGFRRDELIANGDLTPRTAELTLSGEVGNCGDVLGKAPVNENEKGR